MHVYMSLIFSNYNFKLNITFNADISRKTPKKKHDLCDFSKKKRQCVEKKRLLCYYNEVYTYEKLYYN